MKKKIKIEQLTGLRSFAAMLVFLSHSSWDGTSLHLAKIFESGYVGVSFFFLLSGFVLSYSYKERVLNHSLSYLKYSLLRLARLSPLHLLTAFPFVLYAIYVLQRTVLNKGYGDCPSATYLYKSIPYVHFLLYISQNVS